MVTERYTYKELNSLMPTVSKPPPPVPPRARLVQDGLQEEVPVADPVSVYVRVRPLLQEEQDEQLLPGLLVEDNQDLEEGVALKTDQVTIGGFSGVLGPTCDNEAVFQSSFLPRLDTVVQGGLASLFCYGYTGSGKSHTVLGSRGQEGLYRKAAGHLLEQLEQRHPDRQLFLVASACEIYGEQVYDLLGEEKLQCSLRTDGEGNLCVAGPAVRTDLRDVVEECSKLGEGDHATLVTLSRGLRHWPVKSMEDLERFSSTALQQRVVGSSTEHTASSRSHALLRMEVVDQQLLEAKEAVEEAKALLPAFLNALDNHTSECHKKLVVFDGGKDGKVGLRQYPGGQEEWDRTREELQEKKEALQEMVAPVMSRIDAAYRRLEAAQEQEKGTGGVLLLVDLAGADYDKRDLTVTTPQQRKESTDINKSLLALKECFRTIGGVYGSTAARSCFRGSKLTRLLEDSLLPADSSSRRNKKCSGVMIVNVSPAERLAKRTLNVLRYGQIFSDGSKQDVRKTTMAGVRKTTKPWAVKVVDGQK